MDPKNIMIIENYYHTNKLIIINENIIGKVNSFKLRKIDNTEKLYAKKYRQHLRNNF